MLYRRKIVLLGVEESLGLGTNHGMAWSE